jgi:putative oxidoreductase
MFGKCYKWLHNKSVGVLVLRIALGAFFLGHGISKFMNMDQVLPFFASIGLNSFWTYVTATSEVVVGVSLILGIFLWLAAFLLVVMSAVAIIKVTGPNPSEQPFLIHYISSWGSNVIFAAAAVCVAFCGAGRYSLAALWMRRRMKMVCVDCKTENKADCEHNKVCVDCQSDHGLGHNCPTCPPEHRK